MDPTNRNTPEAVREVSQSVLEYATEKKLDKRKRPNGRDLTGLRFGKLTVLGRGPTVDRQAWWSCKCDCGTIQLRRASYLCNKNGRKSCGCAKRMSMFGVPSWISKGKRNPEYSRLLREHVKQQNRKFMRFHTLKKYGISLEMYEAMLRQQDFKCAICAEPHQEIRHKRLAVDHGHASNKVRALLCRKCNSMIGYAKESALILKIGSDYVKHYEQLGAFGQVKDRMFPGMPSEEILRI